jgi:hypothetical protein
MKKLWQENSSSIVFLGLFLFCLLGQSLAGLLQFNNDQLQHGALAISYWQYLVSGEFIEAVAENWESEFLQMGLYVLLTAFLVQKGSPESKDPDSGEDTEEDPWTHRADPQAPRPVRKGGFSLLLYQNSLSLALLWLFAFSFTLHAAGGTRNYCHHQLTHGQMCDVSALQYMGTSQFWFESFQNWQSEFLSVGALLILSIFLRQRGSPESKPVHAPHSQTGK